MQANAQPRNALEALALDVFRAHTGKARFDEAKSGAEWWTQVKMWCRNTLARVTVGSWYVVDPQKAGLV